MRTQSGVGPKACFMGERHEPTARHEGHDEAMFTPCGSPTQESVGLVGGLVLVAAIGVQVLQAQLGTPEQAVAELIAADRAFSKASAQQELVAGLSAMFAGDVVMPVPGAKFARGAAAAAAALRGNPDNEGARAEWTPVRGGISADGQHGFTFGYMTITRATGAKLPAKYLAYWIRKPEGWRVAVYRRSPADEAPPSVEMMPPSLPDRLVPVSTDTHAIARFRESLDAAERAFSDEAQKIGIGRAFVKYGSADAINLGPASESTVTVGSDAIGRAVGAGSPPNGSSVTWAPDSVIVSSSGDLGVTIGEITPNRPGPDGRTRPPIPFFTIWRRASVTDPWRYIAE